MNSALYAARTRSQKVKVKVKLKAKRNGFFMGLNYDRNPFLVTRLAVSKKYEPEAPVRI